MTTDAITTVDVTMDAVFPMVSLVTVTAAVSSGLSCFSPAAADGAIIVAVNVAGAMTAVC